MKNHKRFIPHRPKYNCVDKLKAAAAEITARDRRILCQLGLDSAMAAANKVFNLGPKRAKEFAQAYAEHYEECLDLMYRDGADDKEMVYTRHVMDQSMRRIVGEENFVPWDERYGRD